MLAKGDICLNLYVGAVFAQVGGSERGWARDRPRKGVGYISDSETAERR
jgi:hypothetical protein